MERVSAEESKEYFYERPVDSQIGALTSKQSTVIQGRDVLDQKEKEIRENLKPGEAVPMPNWGGFVIKPHMVEFWQGQSNRLHDRIVFRKPSEFDKNSELTKKGENGWVYERLAP